MPLVHHQGYAPDLPAGHRFPMAKFALLFARLQAEGLAAPANTHVPAPIPRDALLRVHDAAYVDAVLARAVPPAIERRIGLPVDDGVARRALLAGGGTLLAARLALRHGLACNTAGGSHHARADSGAGFCIFNDVAVAVRALQAEGLIRRALIVDLDVHQGDGTAAIFRGDSSVFTLSVHCGANFPVRKEAGDLDIDLPAGTGDADYLAALAPALARALAAGPYDLAFYNAGVDVHADDRLGLLALSDEGIAARDRHVLAALRESGLPVAGVIGGGYMDDVAALAGRHAILHRTAAALISRRSAAGS
ncbi:acetoin utilization deacetylase AcuC-like enzyme [Zavarzinia compransoris]|nr:acetoin utilization deacetylase AcuC-like enzyme [Zavarzinia compransoris]